MKVSVNYKYKLKYVERDNWFVCEPYLYVSIRYKTKGSLISSRTSVVVLRDARRGQLEEWISEGNMEKIDTIVVNKIKEELGTSFKSSEDIEFINSAIKKHNKKSSKWKKTTFEL